MGIRDWGLESGRWTVGTAKAQAVLIEFSVIGFQQSVFNPPASGLLHLSFHLPLSLIPDTQSLFFTP